MSLLEREVPSKLAIKSQGRVVVFLLKNPVHHEHSSLEREGKKAPRKQREVSDSICSNNIPLIALMTYKGH